MIDPTAPKLSETSKGRLMRGVGLILAIWASGKTHPRDDTGDLLTRARTFVAFMRGRA